MEVKENQEVVEEVEEDHPPGAEDPQVQTHQLKLLEQVLIMQLLLSVVGLQVVGVVLQPQLRVSIPFLDQRPGYGAVRLHPCVGALLLQQDVLQLLLVDLQWTEGVILLLRRSSQPSGPSPGWGALTVISTRCCSSASSPSLSRFLSSACASSRCLLQISQNARILSRSSWK